MQTMARLTLALAVATLLLPLQSAPSAAGTIGEAPWCAVQNLGAGDVVWDCEYPSAEACAPNVVAGNRGFCNMNPRWVPAAVAGPYQPDHYPYRHHRRHHYRR
jgi:hypothetical protein